MRTLFILALAILLGSSELTQAQEFRIGTWNLEWFFDNNTSDDSSAIGPTLSAPNQTEWDARVTDVANAVKSMNLDVLALQEIENEKVIEDLADELKNVHGLEYKVEFVQGLDTHTGQDVGFLLRKTLPSNAVRFTYTSANGPKNVSKHLRLETTLGGETVVLVTVHLITKAQDRIKQAQTLRSWLDGESGNVIVLGDFNTGLQPGNTSAGTDMGIIRGLGTTSTTDDITDLHSLLPSGQQVTHVGGKAFDRILASASLTDNAGLRVDKMEQFSNLATKGAEDNGAGVDYSLPPNEQDVSDHFPLVVTLKSTGTSPVAPPHFAPTAPNAVTLNQIKAKIQAIETQLDELKSMVEQLEN